MASHTPTLTADEARRAWSYDPDTGILRWRIAAAQKIHVGDVAGSPKRGAYLFVGYRGRVYAAHRLIWLIQTGEWPPRNIDHRDTVKSNNRWENLRLATKAQNNANVGLRRDNTSGIKGVSYRQSGRGRKRWVASISHEGKSRQIGRYGTAAEAEAAYRAEAIRLKGDFARF